MAPKVSASAKAAQPKKGKKVESSSDSSSDSSSEDSDSSDDEPPKKQTVVAKGKGAPVKKAESSDSSSDDSSSDSSSEDEKPAPKAAPAKAAPAAKAAPKKAESSDESSSDSESDSDEDSPSESSSDEAESEPATPVTGKKHARDDGESSAKRQQDEGIPVFVGFSKQMDEDAIRKFFAGYEISGIEIPASAAVVRFAQFPHARAVAELNGRETDKVHVTATLFPRQREFGNGAGSAPSTPTQGAAGASSTVFVGNMPFDADEESLRQHFASVGEIVNVRIAMDRETGRPRGFGHIEFSSVDEANKAVAEMNGSEYGGRQLRIDNEGNKTPGSAGGRGGRGRGFGGDRGFGGRGGDRGRGFGGRGGDRGRGFGGRGGDRGRGRGGSGMGSFEGKKITF